MEYWLNIFEDKAGAIYAEPHNSRDDAIWELFEDLIPAGTEYVETFYRKGGNPYEPGSYTGTCDLRPLVEEKRLNIAEEAEHVRQERWAGVG